MKYMTTQSFRKKYGSNEACLKALLELRVGEKRLCIVPGCVGQIDKDYHTIRKRKAFICTKCLKHIYPMASTLFDHTHIELKVWFEIIFQMLYSRNGISAFEIHRTTGISYKTVFKMLHRVREAMTDALYFDLQNTVVEVDESYVKTGNKGLSRHYRFSTGRGSLKHTSILTITERGKEGKAKLFVIPATDAESIEPFINENIPTSTLIYTDSWGAYNKLVEKGYTHAMVNHSIEFVDGSASTNCAENMFSNFKRIVVGTWRNVSEPKLQGYLNEQAVRHSFRHLHDYGFEMVLRALIPEEDMPTTEYKNAA